MARQVKQQYRFVAPKYPPKLTTLEYWFCITPEAGYSPGMRLVVVGGSGLLGGELARQAVLEHDFVVATYAHERGLQAGVEWQQLDITDRRRTLALIRALSPDVVVNAAYQQMEWAVTADGAANIAMAAMMVGAQSVLISSDAVFSGRASPYCENDRPDPITAYGAAKAAAETAVGGISTNALIVRTSLIISDDGRSEHEHRTYAACRGEGGLFVDDIRCPVHVKDLAAAVLELIDNRAGVHHVSGPQALSRYELGRLIAWRDGVDPDSIGQAKRSNLPSPGPAEVRLDSTATQHLLDTRLRSAAEFLHVSTEAT